MSEGEGEEGWEKMGPEEREEGELREEGEEREAAEEMEKVGPGTGECRNGKE